jgi:hypothetical protein
VWFGGWFARKQNCRENHKTRVSVQLLSFENAAVYEIMWKNNVQFDRPEMTIWRLRVAYWLPKTTNANSRNIYNNYCLSTATLVAQTRLNVTSLPTLFIFSIFSLLLVIFFRMETFLGSCQTFHNEHIATVLPMEQPTVNMKQGDKTNMTTFSSFQFFFKARPVPE